MSDEAMFMAGARARVLGWEATDPCLEEVVKGYIHAKEEAGAVK